jgi:hypothetical protein
MAGFNANDESRIGSPYVTPNSGDRLPQKLTKHGVESKLVDETASRVSFEAETLEHLAICIDRIG